MKKAPIIIIGIAAVSVILGGCALKTCRLRNGSFMRFLKDQNRKSVTS